MLSLWNFFLLTGPAVSSASDLSGASYKPQVGKVKYCLFAVFKVNDDKFIYLLMKEIHRVSNQKMFFLATFLLFICDTFFRRQLRVMSKDPTIKCLQIHSVEDSIPTYK